MPFAQKNSLLNFTVGTACIATYIDLALNNWHGDISLVIWQEYEELTGQAVQRQMININCHSEMQKHLLHNILHANIELEN